MSPINFLQHTISPEVGQGAISYHMSCSFPGQVHGKSRKVYRKLHPVLNVRKFPNANPQNAQDITLGKCFASPRKSWTFAVARAKSMMFV